MTKNNTKELNRALERIKNECVEYPWHFTFTADDLQKLMCDAGFEWVYLDADDYNTDLLKKERYFLEQLRGLVFGCAISPEYGSNSDIVMYNFTNVKKMIDELIDDIRSAEYDVWSSSDEAINEYMFDKAMEEDD